MTVRVGLGAVDRVAERGILPFVNRHPIHPVPAGWPTSEIWVPHLRDGFIVAKVGHRAKRDPSFFVRLGISGLGRVRRGDSDDRWTMANPQAFRRGFG